MSFETDFQAWLLDSLTSGVPDAVQAFSFNLFEYSATPTTKFGVELVGTASFDKEDSDWACDEVWEPANRQLEIPMDFSGSDWPICLYRVKQLVEQALIRDSAQPMLTTRLAVGIGFVDGDLEVIWQR